MSPSVPCAPAGVCTLEVLTRQMSHRSFCLTAPAVTVFHSSTDGTLPTLPCLRQDPPLKDPAACKADAMDNVRGWHWGVADVIRRTDEAGVSRARIMDRWMVPGRPIGAGALSLVGDALHPCTPNLGASWKIFYSRAEGLCVCVRTDSRIHTPLHHAPLHGPCAGLLLASSVGHPVAHLWWFVERSLSRDAHEFRANALLLTCVGKDDAVCIPHSIAYFPCRDLARANASATTVADGACGPAAMGCSGSGKGKFKAGVSCMQARILGARHALGCDP